MDRGLLSSGGGASTSCKNGVISFSAVKGLNDVGITASLVGMTSLKVVLNRGGES